MNACSLVVKGVIRLSDIELNNIFWVNVMVELVRKGLLVVFVVGHEDRFFQNFPEEKFSGLGDFS